MNKRPNTSQENLNDSIPAAIQENTGDEPEDELIEEMRNGESPRDEIKEIT